MRRIATDEMRHAALAFEVAAWLETRLDPPARARVHAARKSALAELAARTGEMPAHLRAALGFPTARESRRLAEQLADIAA
jgi:hypothetical protein